MREEKGKKGGERLDIGSGGSKESGNKHFVSESDRILAI
jgi:hypothetical protein